jgi:hypothetical protein
LSPAARDLVAGKVGADDLDAPAADGGAALDRIIAIGYASAPEDEAADHTRSGAPAGRRQHPRQRWLRKC